MSYDLFFYKRKTDLITKSGIENYLNALSNLESNSENQWFFQNKDSGAYWTFEYYPPDENERGSIDIEDGYEDLEDTNFMFNINFVRPDFFGHEAFTIAEKIAEDLNLFIFNPQAEAISKNSEKGTFEKEWIETNKRYANNYFEEWGLNYLELDKSEYTWSYNLKRVELQNQYGKGYFVPKIFYVKKYNSRIVETLCVWPEHIPYILPKVDLVLIEKKIPRLFWRKQVEGLIRYSDLVSKVESSFSKEGNYMVLHTNESRKLSKAFNGLSLFDTFSGYGEGIGVDRFVNVKPDIDLI